MSGHLACAVGSLVFVSQAADLASRRVPRGVCRTVRNGICQNAPNWVDTVLHTVPQFWHRAKTIVCTRVPACVARPFTLSGSVRMLLPVLSPAAWRAMRYWRKATWIAFGYLRTHFRAKRVARTHGTEGAQAVWQEQHLKGSAAIRDMLVDLQGFYLKLGQILAAKTDMLPAVYTQALSTLFDDMPHDSERHVARTLRAGLGKPVLKAFLSFEWDPMASATIAQVHKARLPDGQQVVVKVVHSSARKMMHGDLMQLRMCTTLMKKLNINLGFDLHSIVSEYCVQVPLEFDFRAEAAAVTHVAGVLAHARRTEPALEQLTVPTVLPELSSQHVLTMTYIRGVPLADAAALPRSSRMQLCHAIVKAYGHMIIRDGFFHSDPHPGNLLAVNNGGDSVSAALLDFGQCKSISAATRHAYARLVVALASRDAELIRTEMRKAGIVVEKCSPEFQAVACIIMFDTRSDFPEATMSPADPQAHEFRTTSVTVLPQQLFMIMRVMTLLRGVFRTLRVDVHACALWQHLAAETLAESTEEVQRKALKHLALHSSAEARAFVAPLLREPGRGDSARSSPEPPSLTDSVSDVIFSVDPRDEEHPHFRRAPTASHAVSESSSVTISRQFSNVNNPAFTAADAAQPQRSASATSLDPPTLERVPQRSLPMVAASVDDGALFDPAAVSMAPPLGIWSLRSPSSVRRAHGTRRGTGSDSLGAVGGDVAGGVRESVADAQHVLNSSFTHALSHEQGRGSIDMLRSFGDLHHLDSGSVDRGGASG